MINGGMDPKRNQNVRVRDGGPTTGMQSRNKIVIKKIKG